MEPEVASDLELIFYKFKLETGYQLGLTWSKSGFEHKPCPQAAFRSTRHVL